MHRVKLHHSLPFASFSATTLHSNHLHKMEAAKETIAQAGAAFREDGAVGSQFKADGALGGTAQAIGGPFDKHGAIGNR